MSSYRCSGATRRLEWLPLLRALAAPAPERALLADPEIPRAARQVGNSPRCALRSAAGLPTLSFAGAPRTELRGVNLL